MKALVGLKDDEVAGQFLPEECQPFPKSVYADAPLNGHVGHVP
jgi:hypothetical protein